MKQIMKNIVIDLTIGEYMGFSKESVEHELIGFISRTWLLVKQNIKKRLHDVDYDLTFEQIVVLHILQKEEGQNLGMIADRADRERTTISRMVDGLEKRNLVVRIPDKTDKRQKMLYLTQLGKERLKDMEPMGEEFYTSVYADISPKEVESCLATLKKMFSNLEKK